MAIITLLTDFGVQDTYVGQMKGAILAIAPTATLVDLSHAVPAQDVSGGAFLLWSAVEACPGGSIHVAVVDPGVGSARRGLAALTPRGDLLVGPDNGLLLPAAERLGGVRQIVALTEPAYWRGGAASSTFHGRDIFAPVAAHLASGVPLEHLGPPVADPVALALPVPDGNQGEIVHVDTYGNLVTNFAVASLPPEFDVQVAGQRVPRRAFYAAAAPGELLALVGSSGLLEISARDASAAAATGAQRGTSVTLHPL